MFFISLHERNCVSFQTIFCLSYLSQMHEQILVVCIHSADKYGDGKNWKLIQFVLTKCCNKTWTKRKTASGNGYCELQVKLRVKRAACTSHDAFSFTYPCIASKGPCDALALYKVAPFSCVQQRQMPVFLLFEENECRNCWRRKYLKENLRENQIKAQTFYYKSYATLVLLAWEELANRFVLWLALRQN